MYFMLLFDKVFVRIMENVLKIAYKMCCVQTLRVITSMAHIELFKCRFSFSNETGNAFFPSFEIVTTTTKANNNKKHNDCNFTQKTN